MVFSPHFFKPIATAPILVTLGGANPPEFHWQSDQFVKNGNNTMLFFDYHAEPDVDHFGVVERLANIDSDIFQKVKSWLL